MKIEDCNYPDLGENRIFRVIFRGNIGFWGKNGGWFVKLWGLGKIGKKKALENARKRLKIFEKLCEIFEK